MMQMDSEKLRSAIEAAIEAREDGDYEESAEQLAALHAEHPDSAEVAIEYSRSLARVRRHAEGDAVLTEAVRRHPDDAGLCRIWSYAPTQVNDFGEVIRRAEILRARFASAADANEWTSLCVEFDALYESAQWSRLSERLDAHWDTVRRHPVVLPAALVATGKLFQPMRTRLMMQSTEKQAWNNLAPDARENLELQTAIAVENQKLAHRAGYRVVSLGQNCLPYQLLGRWGLVTVPGTLGATPAKLTPFDLGGFTADHAANSIATGFRFLEERGDYSVVAAWGGGEMLSHRPTGIGFFHERGPWWIGERERFFGRIRGLVAGWDDVLATERRIFVFCLCGAGDPAKLVHAVIEYLLGPDDFLVVLDVLGEPHAVPSHERVLYRHCPYPRDYDWTDFGQQLSSRGLRFELAAIEPVTALMKQLSPRSEVEAGEAAGRLALLQDLREQAQSRGLGEVADALRLLARVTPAIEDADAQLEEAEMMRLAGLPDEAETILSRALAVQPHHAGLRRAWATAPGRAGDWVESLLRARLLRQDPELASDDMSRIAVAIELKALQELGNWHEIPPLVDSNRDVILRDRELFGAAAEALYAAFARPALRSLVAAAAGTIGPADEIRAGILDDLADADRNAWRLRDADTRLLCIGQDATGFLLTGRWGLQPARTDHRGLSFFELGGFDGNATAVALEGGVAQFLNPENYAIVPAWFGGMMPVHRATGANFYLYRRQRWEDGDLGAFISGLFENVERWRQVRTGGRRVYLFVATQGCDLERLADAFRQQLAGNGARLVVLDLRPGTRTFADAPGVTYLQRTPPEGWEVNLSLLSPNPAALEFERALVDEILELATEATLVAAE